MSYLRNDNAIGMSIGPEIGLERALQADTGASHVGRLETIPAQPWWHHWAGKSYWAKLSSFVAFTITLDLADRNSQQTERSSLG